MGNRGRVRSGILALAAMALLLSACEWRSPRADAGRSGYSAGEQTITPSNAGSLHELWRAPLATSSGSSVLVSEGRVVADQAAFPLDGTGCTGSPVVCAPLWTYAAVGGGEHAVMDDYHYFDVVATDFSGHRSIGAFDADGTMGCSGTPKVCNPLWWTEPLPSYAGPRPPEALGTDGTLYALTASGRIGAYPTLDTSSCDATLPVVCHPVREFALPDTNIGELAVSGTMLYVEVDSNVFAFDASGAQNCSAAVPAVCTPKFRTQRDTNYGYDLVVAGGRIYQQTEEVAGNGAWGVEAFDAAGQDNCGLDSTYGSVVCWPVWAGHFNSTAVRSFEFAPIVVTPDAVYQTALYGFDPVTAYVYAWDANLSRNCGPGTAVTPICYPIYRATGVRDPVAAGDVLLAAGQTGNLQVFDAAGSTACSSFLQTCPARATLSVPNGSGPLLPAIAEGRVAVHTTDPATGSGLVQVFGL